MKNEKSALARLEAIIAKENTKFILESDTVAARTTDGTLRHRSHTLRLNKENGSLYWVNENSKDWRHEFDSIDEATGWWNRMVLSRVVKKEVQNGN